EITFGMEMFANLIDKDQLKEPVTIPLTVAIKIFTKTLENRCNEIFNSKDHPLNLINNAKSACDRYNFLFHSDIKCSQGICGISGHWIIGNKEEWRNELDEMRQKEIQENALKILQNKPAGKKRNKWMQQGPLGNNQPILTKKKGKQEAEDAEIEQQKKQENKISWADDAEIAFGDVGPQQTLNFNPISKDIKLMSENTILESQGFNVSGHETKDQTEKMSKNGEGENLFDMISFGDKQQSDDFIDNLSIGNSELKESRKNDREMENTDEENVRTRDLGIAKTSNDVEENMKTPDIGFVKMSDDNDENIRTSDIKTSDKNIRAPDARFIPQKTSRISPVQPQDTYHERKSKEKSHSQEDADATTVSEYLLKYSKVIYNALLAELESRQFLYEIDKKPRMSECPTGRRKKRGQKKRKYENKLWRHSVLVKDEGLAVRRNNVERLRKVVVAWGTVVCDVENSLLWKGSV
ncbi:9357_t:CDS:2, partial [Dentiscutata heterogama]